MHFDPALQLGGRHDASRVAVRGGLNVRGALGGAFGQGNTIRLVEWNQNQPARGEAIRLWVTPFAPYNLQTCVGTGNANSAAAELLIKMTGEGGAGDVRRIVVNGGQESILFMGTYQSGSIEVVAASVGANTGNALEDELFVNFAWMTAFPDSIAVDQGAVSRVFEVAVNPITPVNIIVPPGAVEILMYAPIYVTPIDFDWPQAPAPSTTRQVLPAGTPQSVLGAVPPGQAYRILGAKQLALLAPIGFPYASVAFRFRYGVM